MSLYLNLKCEKRTDLQSVDYMRELGSHLYHDFKSNPIITVSEGWEIKSNKNIKTVSTNTQLLHIKHRQLHEEVETK